MPVFSPSQHSAKPLPWNLWVNPLLQVTVVWCIFSFKIFLISFGEAGLRPDDLLILASFLALVLAGRIRRTPISPSLWIYFAYLGIELISAVWNAGRGRVGLLYSLVFAFRLLEYVAFYFIGYSLARSGFRLLRVVRLYAYTLCVVVPLQLLGLFPTPNAFGSSRASGNTNGPYELAVVSGFLLCFIAYRKRNLLIGAATVTLVVLTASRITLIATVVSLLHFAVKRARSVGRVIALGATLVFLGGGLYFLSSIGVVHLSAFDRLQNSSSLGIEDARALYDAAPVAQSSTEYTEGSFGDLNGLDIQDFDGDMSGLIRFSRWLILLKTNFAHIDSVLIGLGPSFGSAAVDGYYTRCYVETGLLGLGAFLTFLGSMLFSKRHSNWNFRDYVLIMIISALFIDVFLSYKSMMLLWLWHGMNQYQPKVPATARDFSKPAPLLLEGNVPLTGTASA